MFTRFTSTLMVGSSCANKTAGSSRNGKTFIVTIIDAPQGKRVPCPGMRKAIHHLKRSDPVMAQIIERIGAYKIEYREPVFQTLVRSIVYQQLHGKAAAAIFGRLKEAARVDPRLAAATAARARPFAAETLLYPGSCASDPGRQGRFPTLRLAGRRGGDRTSNPRQGGRCLDRPYVPDIRVTPPRCAAHRRPGHSRRDEKSLPSPGSAQTGRDGPDRGALAASPFRRVLVSVAQSR